MGRIVVRAAKLPLPRKISDNDFRRIVRLSKIPTTDQAWLRQSLEQLVEAFAEEVSRKRKEPTRQADTDHIDKAQKAITKARQEIRLASGPVGISALNLAAADIGALVSASWLRVRFPDDAFTPAEHLYVADDRTGRVPSRAPTRPIELDEVSLQERIAFAQHRARELIMAILDSITAALKEARFRIVTPRPGKKRLGGRKPLTLRRYVLANLARIWARLGLYLVGTEGSDFAVFCDLVFTSIGWPTEGLEAALPDAIKLAASLGPQIRPV